jgi:hypothetical protein
VHRFDIRVHPVELTRNMHVRQLRLLMQRREWRIGAYFSELGRVRLASPQQGEPKQAHVHGLWNIAVIMSSQNIY